MLPLAPFVHLFPPTFVASRGRAAGHCETKGKKVTAEPRRKETLFFTTLLWLRSGAEEDPPPSPVTSDHGPHLPGAHRRPPPVLVRPVRHLPDQPQRAHLDAVHWRHREGLPIQQGGQLELQVRRGGGGPKRVLAAQQGQGVVSPAAGRENLLTTG